MKEELIRTEMLLGADALTRLSRARVAVFGLGGVGGYAVEALARSGIGALDLFDHDTVSPSNMNRQLFATTETVGQLKTEAAAARLRAIAPDCRVTLHPVFYLPENAAQFDLSSFDYILDAIDTVTAKLTLAEQAQQADVPLISVMGTGNKLDPTAFTVTDIFETSGCPLARIMRKECRVRGIQHLRVVYSTEPPRPVGNGAPNIDESGKRRRDVPGSVSFVPGVAGLIAAGEIIRTLSGVENA